MRVLMIAQSNFNHDGRIIRLSSALINHNIKVDLICLRYDDQSDYEEVNGIRFFRIMRNYPKDKVISYLAVSLFFLIKAFIKTTSLALQEKYNLVHVHNMPDYLVFAAFFFKLKKVPVILDMHDVSVELFKDKWGDKKFYQFKFLIKFVEKVSCAFADHVITVTKECLDILLKHGINVEKTSLIMNSADENLFRYSDERFSRDEKKGFKFLYHGTVERRFGLHYFLNAMPEILKIVPDAEFHLYGTFTNEYSNELRHLIYTLKLTKSVIFNEAVPYTKVSDMIKDFDMGIITYERTEYMNLALPTKAVEYALTGLPFIISDLISVHTIFQDKSVCYINPEDIESIVYNVNKLINNKVLREEMARYAFADILKISWSIMSSKYLELVHTLTRN